jgi:hypothetical protein
VWSSNLRDGMRGLAFAKILLIECFFPGYPDFYKVTIY